MGKVGRLAGRRCAAREQPAAGTQRCKPWCHPTTPPCAAHQPALPPQQASQFTCPMWFSVEYGMGSALLARLVQEHVRLPPGAHQGVCRLLAPRRLCASGPRRAPVHPCNLPPIFLMSRPCGGAHSRRGSQGWPQRHTDTRAVHMVPTSQAQTHMGLAV